MCVCDPWDHGAPHISQTQISVHSRATAPFRDAEPVHSEYSRLGGRVVWSTRTTTPMTKPGVEGPILQNGKRVSSWLGVMGGGELRAPGRQCDRSSRPWNKPIGLRPYTTRAGCGILPAHRRPTYTVVADDAREERGLVP